jgi:hypothetical protein
VGWCAGRCVWGAQLGAERRDLDPLEVPRCFVSSLNVVYLCLHTLKDANLALKLMFKLQVWGMPHHPALV